MSEMLYDVQNKTYLTGRSREDGDNYEMVSKMQADNDTENLNQVLRSVGNALSSLHGLLAEYMELADAAPTTNKLQDASNDIVLTLSMPSNFNTAALSTMASTMHRYIVNTAIGDWFTITNKADAAEYYTDAKNAIIELREAMNKRVRPKRSLIL